MRVQSFSLIALLSALCSVVEITPAQAQLLSVQIGTPPPAPTTIVAHGSTWRWRRGTNAPAADWRVMSDAALDSTWLSGPGGFGYGDTIATEATTISGMRNVHGTLYVRRAFQVSEPVDPSAELRLMVDYDDGFVAYLDGIELIRANVNGASNAPVSNTAFAAGDREASCCTSPNPPATFNLGPVGERLGAGTHVLSFIALNDSLGSSDLHIIPDLMVVSAQSTSGIIDRGLYALTTSNNVVLVGSNTIAGSTRISVNGDEASYNMSAGTWTKSHMLQPGMNHLFIAALDDNGNLLGNISRHVIYQSGALEVGGTLAANTSWNNPGTIVFATNNITVPTNGSLTVGAGVVVILSPGASIIAAESTVTISGTSDSRAVFLPVVTNGWGGLTARGSNAALTIQHGEIVAGQVILRSGATALLEDSIIRDLPDLSREVIDSQSGTSLTLRRVYATRFTEFDSQDTPLLIEDSLLEGFLVDGLDIKTSTGVPLVVRRTTLRNADPNNSNADGIDFGPGAGTVADCLIHGFPDKGVSIGGAPGTRISNSLIYECGVGISAYASTNVVVENTTVSLCLTGMFFRANPTPGFGTGTNVIVWGNNYNFVLSGGSTLALSYSDTEGGAFPGVGNISADPLFVDPAKRDFHLSPGSPAAATGLGGTNMGVTLPVGGIPPAPVNLAAISSGTNFVTIQWQDDAANENEFLIERSIDGAAWQQIGSVGRNETNFVDTTGPVGQKYYYRARSTNDSGASLASNIASGQRQPAIIFAGGTISSDTIWGPGVTVVVTSSVNVASSATLTIKPGVAVLVNQGVSITANGTLIAEGDADNHIIFRPNAGATTWSTLDLFGSANSHRLIYVDLISSTGNIDATGTTIFLDHVGWTNTTAQLVDCVSSSLTLLDSYIPGGASVEPIHFSNMPANGHALIKGNVFAPPQAYNDSADFTGGNRPGPIVQFIDNVFLAAVDDCFDMDGTDAHIEGNIFMNVHQDAVRDSTANAVATGADGTQTSELVVVRNIFYDCDHALLIKDFGSILFDNNTVVTVRTNAPARTGAAYIQFSEPHRGTPGGRGILMNGNIMWDLRSSTPFLYFTNGTMFMVANQNIVQGTNMAFGGNSSANPLFVNMAGPMTYLNIKSNLSLALNSPARGTGPNGLDRGALVPGGASISGEPIGTTTNDWAVLNVAGPGVYAYRWKLNDGPWSSEVALTNNFLITATMFANATPITVSNLADGTYTIRVIGKNSAGAWQEESSATVSRTWTVNTSSTVADTDADGMPDSWELANGFDKDSSVDAALDADDDGMSNLEEFIAGTDPRDASSTLKLAIEATALNAEIRFTAVSNVSYNVEYRTSLSTGAWLNLETITAAGTNRILTITNELDATRFFRVRAN